MARKSITIHAINTGVPHALYFLPPSSTPADLASFPLVPFGRAVRHHPLFAPAGTNVDVALVLPSASTIRLRTYERGVEAETLACGTGITASALVAIHLGWTTSPATLRTPSGFTLQVTLSPLTLTGPTSTLYTATLSPSLLP